MSKNNYERTIEPAPTSGMPSQSTNPSAAPISTGSKADMLLQAIFSDDIDSDDIDEDSGLTDAEKR